MAIKKQEMTSSIMKSFVNDFNDTSDNKYYIFASSLENDSVSNDSSFGAYGFLEKTIFGKKFDSNDVKYVIKRNVWIEGEIYDQYDDRVDLSSSNFYVITEPEGTSGEYHVFKCLYNNNGLPSIEKPVYNTDLYLTRYVLEMSDGYIWKYMYSVSETDARFYGTRNLFPIFDNVDVKMSATDGIETIFVENETNAGYEEVRGLILSLGQLSGNNQRINISSSTMSQISNYYNGMSFYVTSEDGIRSKLYKIVGYGYVDASTSYVDIEGYSQDDFAGAGIRQNYTFSILPTVEIEGDGSGAIAIPVLVGSRIERIRILDTGSGYTRAVARVVDPSIGFDPTNVSTGDERCELRVIISPNGGHGYDVAFELYSNTLIVTTDFTRTDSENIPSTNSYSKVGIVKTPTFIDETEQPIYPDLFDNRILAQIFSTSQVSPGDIASQTETGFVGVVHEVDYINNYVYITEFFNTSETRNLNDQLYVSSDASLSTDYPIKIGGNNININTQSGLGVVQPEYVQRTGEVLYITDFSSIERSEDLAEQFKFIIEF